MRWTLVSIPMLLPTDPNVTSRLRPSRHPSAVGNVTSTLISRKRRVLSGDDDAELSIRARAMEVSDRGDRLHFEAACREAGVNVEADGPAFELLIDRVDTTVWENCGQPDTRPSRGRWRSVAS